MTQPWSALAVPFLALAQGEQRPLTFADDVAPIVRARCAPCHSPGQAGPFALTSFEDVSKRVSVIADVVERRVMPPWLPVPGEGGPFIGERRLSETERVTLLAWIAQGGVSGDLAKIPAAPSATPEWQLGRPDLELRLPQAVTVPAEGRDVYRNFVIATGLGETRFVRALEFEPGNRRVVHHAAIGVDASGGARALDARDEAPGFPGMNMGGARLPDGHFLGWAPGKRVDPGREDMAWRLEPGEDLVLQMHLRPSGKPETLQPRIALYFAKSPPTLRPTAIVLSALDLDIPAGTANYVSERAYRLPVAASVLAICPHAHYLGKDLHAWATLPDGRDVPLIRLFPWDFNWQDSYRYLEPVALPAGALVHMRYTYDNTAENALNPSAPPRRVVYGENASDEMGELLLQLLPAKTEERAVLERDFAKYMERENLTYLRGLLLRSPNDVRLRYSVALALERLDEFSPALELLRGLVTERPRDSMTRTVYGRVLVRSGDLELASDELARARTDLTKDPRTRAALVAALTLLGDAQRARGDEPAAMQSFARALELDPADATARQRIQR